MTDTLRTVEPPGIKSIDTPGRLPNVVARSDSMKRKILVILSNRWDRNQTPRFLELDCDAEGNIHKQRRLSRRPGAPRYDEVWENDEGKTDFNACHRFLRKYGHKLQKGR